MVSGKLCKLLNIRCLGTPHSRCKQNFKGFFKQICDSQNTLCEKLCLSKQGHSKKFLNFDARDKAIKCMFAEFLTCSETG